MKKNAIVLSFFLGVSIVQEAGHHNPNPNPQRVPYFSINANGSNANIVSRVITNDTNVPASANTARQLNMGASLTVAQYNNANTVQKAT